MSILRVQKRKDNPYVVIDKRPLEDARLSWKARGLLAYLLAKPDNWQVRVKHLETQAPGGRHALQSALKELRSFGYMDLVQTRDNAGKLTGSEYIIYEVVTEMQETCLPVDDREAGFPTVGKPVPIVINDKKLNNNLNTTNLNNPHPLSSTPREEDGRKGGPVDLSFLTGKDRQYEDSIRAELKNFGPDQIDFAYRKIMLVNHRGYAPLDSILAIQREFGHTMMMAAMVYAAAEGKGGASLKFIAGICGKWKRGKGPAFTGQNQNKPWTLPPVFEFQDDDNFSLDPKIKEQFAGIFT